MSDFAKNTLETFKAMYFHELSIKEALHARVAVPLTALSIIATMTIYFLSESRTLPQITLVSFIAVLYYMSIFIIAGLVLYSAAVIFRIVYGHKYGHTPTPQEIQDYASKIQGCSDSDESKLASWESFLNDTYRDAANENRKNNFIKMAQLRKTNLCIIIALFICVLNAVLLVYLK